MYDIAIIGAGPAGATLARLVGGRFKTLVVDRRHMTADSGRPGGVKLCGGLVAPDAQKMLARLSLGLPAAVLTGPQVFAVRAIDLETGLERTYPRHYINIDRARFDRWLVSLVGPEVDLRLGRTVRGLTCQADGVTIEMACDGRSESARARLLVGADGAASLVRRLFAPGRTGGRQYIAIQEVLPASRGRPYFSAYFDSRITDYYAWSIPKGDRLLLGAALPAGRGASELFDRLKARLGAMGLVTGTPVARAGAKILRPMRTGDLCPVAGPAVLIGEAGGWISPSSAEGLSYAFRSALAAAEALPGRPGSFADRYRAAVRGIARNIFFKGFKRRLIYTPPVRRLCMRIGLGALPACAGAHGWTADPEACPP